MAFQRGMWAMIGTSIVLGIWATFIIIVSRKIEQKHDAEPGQSGNGHRKMLHEEESRAPLAADEEESHKGSAIRN